jgi:hypothetical protein
VARWPGGSGSRGLDRGRGAGAGRRSGLVGPGAGGWGVGR